MNRSLTKQKITSLNEIQTQTRMTPKTEKTIQNQRDTKLRTKHTRTQQNTTNLHRTYQFPQKIPENKYNQIPESKKLQWTEHETYQQNNSSTTNTEQK